MRRFINIWLILGILLVIFGWGPLLLIIFLAEIGIWPDPNPNPIGPGLLYFFTFLPAVILLAIGVTVGIRRVKQPGAKQNQPRTVEVTPSVRPDLTPEQAKYVASGSVGAAAGIFYYWHMGVTGTFFDHPLNLIYWPRVIAHGRQEAWDAGNWAGFEQFRQKCEAADSFCRIFFMVGGGLLILLFLI